MQQCGQEKILHLEKSLAEALVDQKENIEVVECTKDIPVS